MHLPWIATTKNMQWTLGISKSSLEEEENSRQPYDDKKNFKKVMEDKKEDRSSSLQKMVEMKKPSKDKCGLGYTENIASSSNTKIKNLVSQIQKMPSVEPALSVPLTTEPASSDEQHPASVDSAENRKNA
ncbi:hypothetical protein Tco_0921091 [Tanacetum coccineum]